VTEYTFSLAVTPANHSHTLAPEKAQAIPDTFGRIYDTISVQLDLFAVSSKTWRGMLLWDSMRFTKTYELWATQLRQDCLQRQKLGHLIREKDCSSWPTPQAFQNRGPLKTEFVDELRFLGNGIVPDTAEKAIRYLFKKAGVNNEWLH